MIQAHILQVFLYILPQKLGQLGIVIQAHILQVFLNTLSQKLGQLEVIFEIFLCTPFFVIIIIF